jgi:hypothetical protein
MTIVRDTKIKHTDGKPLGAKTTVGQLRVAIGEEIGIPSYARLTFFVMGIWTLLTNSTTTNNQTLDNVGIKSGTIIREAYG